MDGMRKLTIIWGSILVVIFGLLIFLGFAWKEKVGAYKDVEEELKNIVIKYKDAATLENDSVKITLKELQEKKIIDKLSIEDCDGYVIIKKNGYVYDYIPYIKCNNYQTKGYE